jgi:5'-nucleotidase / UDP-sugar diphosphatase
LRARRSGTPRPADPGITAASTTTARPGPASRRAVALLLLVALTFAGCGLLRRGPATADLIKLTILQINDTYTLEPVDNGQRGGMARVATLVKELRAKNPNTLFVHAGDFLSPSTLSTYMKGRHMIAALNAIGLDAATIGNHEFDFGPDVLIERMREARFPWILSNVRDRRTGGAFGGAQHDRIVTLGGVRVGLLGLTVPDAARTSAPGPDVVFDDPVRVGREAADALRLRGARIVIALTHQHMATDRALGEQAAIDVIAGGHEHEPLVAETARAIVTKAGSDARYVVQIDLWVTPDGRVVERSWTFHAVGARTAPDPAVETLVAGYTAQLERELGVTIGRTDIALDARRGIVRTQETGIGNFVADVMREALQADVALINGGGLRGDRILPPGPITRRDVYTLLPFVNTVMKLEMSAAALRDALEHGLGQADNQGGGFLQVSGLQMTYDGRRPVGGRLVTVDIAGRPIDAGSRYTVAVPNYVAQGGDGHTAFRAGRVLVGAESAPDLAALVLRAIETRQTIGPRVEGRIRGMGPGTSLERVPRRLVVVTPGRPLAGSAAER